MKISIYLLVAVGSLAAAAAALAAEPIVGSGIDPNTFRVGHPASPRWVAAHAGHEHPAVVQARLARQAHIDPNGFRVQPPASVTWLAEPAPAPLLAQAR